MLNIHILNVGNGNCTILEYHNDGDTSFGVIDSNWIKSVSPNEPPVLTKLKKLKASKISFVAISHPDFDHFKGVNKLFEFYGEKIEELYTFPLDLLGGKERLKEYTKALNRVRSCASFDLRSKYEEFIKIIISANKKLLPFGRWIDCSGYSNKISPIGFKGVDIITILPPSSVKGDFFKRIDEQDNLAVDMVSNNDMSLSFLIRYKGVNVIIGCDGSVKNWENHRRKYTDRVGTNEIESSIVCLPHHGSQRDSSKEVLDYLFASESGGKNIALISANGTTHPHEDVIEWLEDNNIEPYCTNLSKKCISLSDNNEVMECLNPEFAEHIKMVKTSNSTSVPCQGNITLSINNDGSTEVSTEHNTPCPYHSEGLTSLL